jgi:hypothetical protein
MIIEFHGFLPAQTKNMLGATWSKLIAHYDPDNVWNCRVSAVPCTTQGHDGRKSPFIRVYSEKKSDFDFVAKHLKSVKMPGAGLKTFVECILLDKRFEL